MSSKFFRKTAIAAVAIGAVAFAGSQRAEAGIQLTVSSGGVVDTFFSAGNNLATGPFAIDGYTVSIQTVATNFPGTPDGAGLTTTSNVSAGSTAPSPLTVVAQVVDSLNGPLSTFTAPAGSLILTSSVAGTRPITGTGSASITSTANGFSVSAGPISLAPLAAPPASNSGSFTATGFTLQNSTLISGINAGAFDVGITSSTGVIGAVPEPATLAMAFSALPVLGLAAWRRRKAQA